MVEHAWEEGLKHKFPQLQHVDFVIRLLRDGKHTAHTYKYPKITKTKQQQ